MDFEELDRKIDALIGGNEDPTDTQIIDLLLAEAALHKRRADTAGILSYIDGYLERKGRRPRAQPNKLFLSNLLRSNRATNAAVATAGDNPPVTRRKRPRSGSPERAYSTRRSPQQERSHSSRRDSSDDEHDRPPAKRPKTEPTVPGTFQELKQQASGSESHQRLDQDDEAQLSQLMSSVKKRGRGDTGSNILDDFGPAPTPNSASLFASIDKVKLKDKKSKHKHKHKHKDKDKHKEKRKSKSKTNKRRHSDSGSVSD